MKSAMACCSILALALATYSVAQNDPSTDQPETLLKLFEVSDHIGFSRNNDTSGYTLTLSTEQEIEYAKKYHANKQEYDEQFQKLQHEWSALGPAATQEDRSAISKKMAQFQAPRPAIAQVFAMGHDYVGLKRLDGNGDLFIPVHSIVSVSRKPKVVEAETSKSN